MKKSMSSKGSMKKYSTGGSSGPGDGGGKRVERSPGGAYKTTTKYDSQGNVTMQKQTRTLKGLLTGAPRGQGVMGRVYKKGGSVGKSMKKK